MVAMSQAPLTAQKPTEEEVEIAEVFVPVQMTAQAELPATLPATGSLLPLIGLVGLVSLVTVVGIRFVTARGKC